MYHIRWLLVTIQVTFFRALRSVFHYSTLDDLFLLYCVMYREHHLSPRRSNGLITNTGLLITAKININYNVASSTK
jgi:hypothetical protein